jgi:hypothetical protein
LFNHGGRVLLERLDTKVLHDWTKPELWKIKLIN